MTDNVCGQLAAFEDGSLGVAGREAQVMLHSFDEVAEVVRSDERGRYRPLSGARTLPAGWRFPAITDEARRALIETVYPLATVHARQYAAGTLRVVPLDDVLTRQSGRYETTASLSRAGRDRAARLVCTECVRAPVWRGDEVDASGIPCPEPCSVLVAFCREAALWEREPPRQTDPDPSVPWAAFEEPGNELRERYLQQFAESQ